MIDIRDHRHKGLTYIILSKHSTSYQNGLYSEQHCSTSVLAQTTLEEKFEIQVIRCDLCQKKVVSMI